MYNCVPVHQITEPTGTPNLKSIDIRNTKLTGTANGGQATSNWQTPQSAKVQLTSTPNVGLTSTQTIKLTSTPTCTTDILVH